jgi:hypothetical protein
MLEFEAVPITECHKSTWIILLCIEGVCLLLIILILFQVARTFVSL